MPSRTPRRLLVLLASCISLCLVSAPAQAAAGAGEVRFAKGADATFDQFTKDPTEALKGWLNDKYWRIRTFAPYFDSRLSWFADAWAYQNLYAIYRDQDVAAAHPEWILRDVNGNELYIPWECDGQTCTQFAGDVGSPEFRAWWIAEAKAKMAKGYRGVFVDDVNMELRVGDATGREIAPVDPRTGRQMTLATWRRYVAEFTEEIRAALPDKEIVHNAIWFAGDPAADQSVGRQMAAADYIDLERGVDDDGIQGGGGRFGYLSLMGLIDWLHARGKGVIFDANPKTEARREYNLASYFLAGNGNDAIGSDIGGRPEDWWAGYDVSLGAPEGDRYEWRGLLRRDFERGSVLVNRPGEPARTVAFGAPVHGPTGDERAAVTLSGAQGAVLVGALPAAGPTASGSDAETTAATPAGGAGRAGAVLRGRGTLRIRGRVPSGRAAKVRIAVQRRVAGRWVRVRTMTVRANGRGRFARRLPGLAAGRYRVRATVVNKNVHVRILTADR